jgi:glutamate decarboxylase
MPNYSLNFSKGSNTIIAQYYNLIRLGKKGYTDIMKNMFDNTLYLAEELEKSGKFELINKNIIVPLVAVNLKDEDYTVFQVSDKLREKGWIVPAYTLPKDAEDVAVLRIVIKENFGRDMVEMFLSDLMESVINWKKEGVKEDKERENPTLLY